ncbi:MAG TPA: ABC-2 family transporter protein [Candidatus Eisenbacteria bacterium]|nr:ABC-2 family transporter protein [Candidatus Eisenbacteria bacterium]
MKRYLRIYLSFIKINFTLLFTYRASFFLTILYTVFWGIIGIFNMYVLTLRISGAYGWSRNELILLAGIYPIFAGTFYLLCASNIGRIPDIVHRGDLDLILTKPIDSQFILSFRFIDFMQVVRICVCLGFVIFFVHAVSFPFTVMSVIVSMLLMIIGMCIIYSVWFGVVTLSVWFTNLSNLRDLLYIFMGSLRYPSNMFLNKTNFFFAFFIFFSLSITIPIRVLLQKANWWEIGVLFVVASGSILLSRIFWKFALRFYTSASS